uniref:Uncharacterized protein n=1 Tax=Setaria viridis TaxID=4556 RepID=A0A4U6U3V2_SETVI|nr:hypothetical protein SEVIR_6G020050v2 [Setaria viridis]
MRLLYFLPCCLLSSSICTIAVYSKADDDIPLS